MYVNQIRLDSVQAEWYPVLMKNAAFETVEAEHDGVDLIRF